VQRRGSGFARHSGNPPEPLQSCGPCSVDAFDRARAIARVGVAMWRACSAAEQLLPDWNGPGRGYPGNLLVLRHAQLGAEHNPASAMLIFELVDRLGRRYSRRRLWRMGIREIAGRACAFASSPGKKPRFVPSISITPIPGSASTCHGTQKATFCRWTSRAIRTSLWCVASCEPV
jgi:hypothetical protein